MHTGTIKWFSPMKGLGFVSTEANDEYIFYMDMFDGLKNIFIGGSVTFNITDSNHGLVATDIKVV